MQFGGAVDAPVFNLVFPYQNNSDFVFQLGEVTFLNDPINSQCDLPELITMGVPPHPLTTGW